MRWNITEGDYCWELSQPGDGDTEGAAVGKKVSSRARSTQCRIKELEVLT